MIYKTVILSEYFIIRWSLTPAKFVKYKKKYNLLEYLLSTQTYLTLERILIGKKHALWIVFWSAKYIKILPILSEFFWNVLTIKRRRRIRKNWNYIRQLSTRLMSFCSRIKSSATHFRKYLKTIISQMSQLQFWLLFIWLASFKYLI